MDSLQVLAVINAMLNTLPAAHEPDKAPLCEGVMMFGRQLLNDCRTHYDSDPKIIQNIGKLASDVKRYAGTNDPQALEDARAAVASLKGANGFGVRRR